MSQRSRRFAAGVALIRLLSLPLSLDAQSRAQLPADVRAACDNAYAIITRTQGIKTRRSTGSFNDEAFRAPIPGCRIAIDGSFKKAGKSGAAADNFRDALEKGGWTELPEYSADGHDGTSFAFRKAGVACFARGSWEGGSDDEPEIPPSDPYKVTVICGQAAHFIRPQFQMKSVDRIFGGPE